MRIELTSFLFVLVILTAAVRGAPITPRSKGTASVIDTLHKRFLFLGAGRRILGNFLAPPKENPEKPADKPPQEPPKNEASTFVRNRGQSQLSANAPTASEEKSSPPDIRSNTETSQESL